MRVEEMFNPDELPLQNWVTDGGFMKIFRSFAVVGDSLSSGEFESLSEANERSWHDMFEYSWGQYMARTCGSKCYNFSRGGMTAKWYIDSYGDEKDFWSKQKACQAYIIALGVNDLFGARVELGSVDDVKENYRDNAPTFAGYYGRIIQRYKEIQPDAKFFLVTIPSQSGWGENKYELSEKHQQLMYAFEKKFSKTYVVDIKKYGPVYDDDFSKRFFMSGHMNAMGYIFTADMIMSYIDYIIRHNMEDFKLVPFIGTDITNITVKPNR